MPPDWPTQFAAQAAGATSPGALLEIAVEQMRRIFAAPICMILPASSAELDAGVSTGLRALHFREYVDAWRDQDPVRRSALSRYTAMRDEDVPAHTTLAVFQAGFARRLGAGAYLVAPLYGCDGGITGTLHMWRLRCAAGFHDATQAMAFAAFLSVMLAALPASRRQPWSLAPREHQVALLAARGHSNRAIAAQLGLAPETVKQTLRRVYRKISVAGRAELAACCARSGLV